MEDWSVGGSASEEENGGEEGATACLDFGGIKIPPDRLLQLMQVWRRELYLDLLGELLVSVSSRLFTARRLWNWTALATPIGTSEVARRRRRGGGAAIG